MLFGLFSMVGAGLMGHAFFSGKEKEPGILTFICYLLGGLYIFNLLMPALFKICLIVATLLFVFYLIKRIITAAKEVPYNNYKKEAYEKYGIGS